MSKIKNFVKNKNLWSKMKNLSKIKIYGQK